MFNKACSAFTPLQPGNLLISLAPTLSVGFSMSIALHATTQLGGSWLLPPRDFPHHLRVTLWITTAIHLDTPILDPDPPLRHPVERHDDCHEGRVKQLYRVWNSPVRYHCVLNRRFNVTASLPLPSRCEL